MHLNSLGCTSSSKIFVFVAAGGVAIATASALAYGCYKKFFCSRRARATINDPTVIVERERVALPSSGSAHANESYSDDYPGLNSAGSRVQESIPPGSMELVPVEIHGRRGSVATIAASTSTGRTPRGRWTRLNDYDYDPDEDNDFNGLRAWGDGIPLRQFTRRTTSQQKTETHEVTIF